MSNHMNALERACIGWNEQHQMKSVGLLVILFLSKSFGFWLFPHWLECHFISKFFYVFYWHFQKQKQVERTT